MRVETLVELGYWREWAGARKDEAFVGVRNVALHETAVDEICNRAFNVVELTFPRPAVQHGRNRGQEHLLASLIDQITNTNMKLIIKRIQ